jgi:hypothetical protein
MPFDRPSGTEWWVLEPDTKNVTKIFPTKEKAFDTALEHNKQHGVNAVYVTGVCAKRGEWKKSIHERNQQRESLHKQNQQRKTWRDRVVVEWLEIPQTIKWIRSSWPKSRITVIQFMGVLLIFNTFEQIRP